MKSGCPQCGKPVVYSITNRWRPFCSERCKLIDLGDWIEEKNRISNETSEFEQSTNNTQNIKH
jgi:uncharacterized protein